MYRDISQPSKVLALKVLSADGPLTEIDGSGVIYSLTVATDAGMQDFVYTQKALKLENWSTKHFNSFAQLT